MEEQCAETWAEIDRAKAAVALSRGRLAGRANLLSTLKGAPKMHKEVFKMYQHVPKCTNRRPGRVGCILEIYGAAQTHPNTFSFLFRRCVFFCCYPIAGPPRSPPGPPPSPPGPLGRREEGGGGSPGASHLSGVECSKAMYNQGWWVSDEGGKPPQRRVGV